jgi:hypothetical protein
VYKTFGLEAPNTFSLLYSDTRGRSRIEAMDQLKAGNEIYLIEEVTETDLKDEGIS